MKKVLLAGLLLGLLGSTSVLAEETKEYDGIGEMAVGARVTPYGPLQWSLDFLYRPSFGIGGMVVGNSRYTKDFQGKPLVIRTKDATVFIGYWSNTEKKNWLGWHAYFGFGVSFVDVASQKYTANPAYVNHNKYGLGLDFYLKRFHALTIDVSVASRRMQIKHRTVDADSNSEVYQLKSGTESLAFQVGYRFWF